MMRGLLGLVAALGVVAVLACPAPASASWTLTIGDGGTASISGALNTTGTIGFPTPVTVGDFRVNSASGGSSETFTQAEIQFQDLDVTNISGVTATLTITLTENAFLASTPNTLSVTSTASSLTPNSTGGLTATAEGKYNGSSLGVQTWTTSSLGFAGPTPVTSSFAATSPFSLTQVIKITLAPGQSFEGQGTVVAVARGGGDIVPEPGSVTLALTGLATMLGAFVARRRLGANAVV